jgi:hypothetical protein
MIYDSIAREEATCAKDAIVVLRDSPYWDGERRDDDDDDDDDDKTLEEKTTSAAAAIVSTTTPEFTPQ